MRREKRHEQAQVRISALLVVLECLIWGLGNPILKITARTVGPFAQVGLRFAIALLLFMLLKGKWIIQKLRTVRLLPCLLVSAVTAVTYLCATLSLTLTGATIAGFLMGISVLFTPILEPLLLKKRWNLRILLLLIPVCTGMYLLCGAGESFSFGLGEFFAVLCSALFALMLTLTEKYASDVDPFALSAMQCAVATVLCGGCALLFEGGFHFGRMGTESVLALLYIGVFSTCLACFLQNIAMQNIPATVASVAFCLEPVFTALFSFLILGETLMPLGWVGAVVIVLCVLAASLWGDRNTEKPETARNAQV